MIYLLLIFFGLGFALFSSANMNQVMSSVTPKYYGVASSMVGTMRTVGMLTSISIASGMAWPDTGSPITLSTQSRAFAFKNFPDRTPEESAYLQRSERILTKQLSSYKINR